MTPKYFDKKMFYIEFLTHFMTQFQLYFRKDYYFKSMY